MAIATTEPVQWLPTLLMTAGLVVLGVLLTATIRNRIARRYHDEPDPQERIEQIKRNATVRDDFGEAEARYLDTTRRLAAQLDNKASRLEKLIADADDRLAALERAAGSAPAPAHVNTGPISVRPDPLADADPLTRSVYALADAGRGATSIAHELDEPIGEVELILALRRNVETPKRRNAEI